MDNLNLGKYQIKSVLEVDEAWIQSCADYLHRWIPFKLTHDQIWEIFVENTDLLQSSINLGFDTGEREMFMSAIAKKLLGIDWPTYGEPGDPKYEGFHERLIEAGVEYGYKLQEK